MNKKYKLLIFANIVLTVGLIFFLAFYIVNLSEKKEYVYIDNVKLFNGFHMSQDVSKIHKKKMSAQSKKVDSLYQLFQMDIKAKKDQNILKAAQLQLQKEDAELKKMDQYFSSEISQQVWDRLNIYILEYGKQHENKIIFGTQGSGNIMYANDVVDVTENVLQYANAKYEGE